MAKKNGYAIRINEVLEGGNSGDNWIVRPEKKLNIFLCRSAFV
jgi:hypothetical protein